LWWLQHCSAQIRYGNKYPKIYKCIGLDHCFCFHWSLTFVCYSKCQLFSSWSWCEWTYRWETRIQKLFLVKEGNVIMVAAWPWPWGTTEKDTNYQHGIMMNSWSSQVSVVWFDCICSVWLVFGEVLERDFLGTISSTVTIFKQSVCRTRKLSCHH
jgi:hypothetical protein